jgi:phage shock protein C
VKRENNAPLAHNNEVNRMSEQKRLLRSRSERMIAGVCGGLARHFDIDVTLVRLGFIALTFVNGIGLLVYIVLWIVVPDEEHQNLSPDQAVRRNLDDIGEQAQRFGQSLGESLRGGGGGRVQAFIGIGLVGLGVLFLLDQLGWLSFVSCGTLWPLVLVALGVALMLRRRR